MPRRCVAYHLVAFPPNVMVRGREVRRLTPLVKRAKARWLGPTGE